MPSFSLGASFTGKGMNAGAPGRYLRRGSGMLTPSSVWKFSRMAQIVLVVAVRVELRQWT